MRKPNFVNMDMNLNMDFLTIREATFTIDEARYIRDTLNQWIPYWDDQRHLEQVDDGRKLRERG
jgi:hypothetical protein